MVRQVVRRQSRSGVPVHTPQMKSGRRQEKVTGTENAKCLGGEERGEADPPDPVLSAPTVTVTPANPGTE